ncbi:hypothetical protein LOTGIDRAFT_134373, partial [Lottia gigantea]
VRALYRWITAQPVDMMLAPRNKPSTNKPIYHIWAIKNSEGNYSQWFSKLCRAAKIPCVIIHGRLKGSSYQVGQSVFEDEHYGEWNAVLIDGVWRFVDAYWGAFKSQNRLESRSSSHKTLTYTCDENYFLTDPSEMIYSHYPEVPEWQLLQYPWTINKFESCANTKDRFFELGMSLDSHKKCVI